MAVKIARRPLMVALSLALAGLACAYADVPIQPLGQQPLATPVTVLDTATVAPSDTASPEPTAEPPTEAPPTEAVPTEVSPTAGPPTETATLVVEPTATVEGATAEPSATLDPNLPADTGFTSAFTVSADGDFPFGLPRALNDGQTSTWASLRNGQGMWIFDLGSATHLSGVRLYALRDRDEDTTLLGIDVSDNGTAWTALYTPATSCGATAGCLVIPQAADYDLPFGPATTRYVRLRSGPTAFALAEVQFALLP